MSLQVIVDISESEQQVERETFPACAYAALEFCQRHLAAVKKQLVQVSIEVVVFHIFRVLSLRLASLEMASHTLEGFLAVEVDAGAFQKVFMFMSSMSDIPVTSIFSSVNVQQPGQRQRPQKRVAGPPKARPRGGTLPGMRSMPTRNRSMLGLAAKPSMERCSSAKRRRNDYDVSDMIMPHMSGAGGPKFVERVQVSQLVCLPLAMPACVKACSVHCALVPLAISLC